MRGALEQVGVVKDAAMRQAMNSRARFDEVMLQRKRREIFAELGEVVHQLVVQGALGEVAHHPELAEIIGDLDDIAAQLDMVHSGGSGFASGPARWRPGERPGSPASEPASEWSGEWSDWSDGAYPETVSSADWTPPRPGGADGSNPERPGGEFRVWRPSEPDDTPSPPDSVAISPASEPDTPDPATLSVTPPDPPAPTTESAGGTGAPPWQSTRRGARSRRQGRGGIVFASDHVEPEDDLADYMHEDDVPDEPLAPGADDSVAEASEDPSAPGEAGNTP